MLVRHFSMRWVPRAYGATPLVNAARRVALRDPGAPMKDCTPCTLLLHQKCSPLDAPFPVQSPRPLGARARCFRNSRKDRIGFPVFQKTSQ